MLITYKNNRLERVLIGINALAAAVVGTFVGLFGFDKPFLLSVQKTTIEHLLQQHSRKRMCFLKRPC
jgi:hypothetical protein